MKKRSNREQHRETHRENSPEQREEQIQRRAYDLFIHRGQEPGHDLEDWFQAEREVHEWEETKKVG